MELTEIHLKRERALEFHNLACELQVQSSVRIEGTHSFRLHANAQKKETADVRYVSQLYSCTADRVTLSTVLKSTINRMTLSTMFETVLLIG